MLRASKVTISRAKNLTAVRKAPQGGFVRSKSCAQAVIGKGEYL